jgi:YD repeat-containing protein
MNIRINNLARWRRSILFTLALWLGEAALTAQTPLLCGQSLTNALTILGQRDAYTYNAAGGEMVTIRMAGLSGGVDAFLELRDGSSNLIASAANQLNRTLTNAGAYLIIAYDSGNNEIGNYSLALQRLTNPCDPAPVGCGDILSAGLATIGELDVYALTATGGEVVTLRLVSTNTTLFNPKFELFDPLGRPLTVTSGTTFTGMLTNGGIYTALVSYNTGSSRVGNYWLTAERVKDACDAVALACGAVVTNSLSQIAELDAYRFDVPAGGELSRVRLESGTANFTPGMELYDTLGRLVGSGSTSLSGGLTNEGVHTVLVRHTSGTSRTGDYRLAYERLTNACDTLALNCGNVVASALTSAGKLDAYSLSAAGGEVVMVRLVSTNTTRFNPKFELFDPLGRPLTVTSGTTFTGMLTNGGIYTALVSYNTGSSRTGNYWLTVERLKDACDTFPLACGTALTNSIHQTAEIDMFTLVSSGNDIVALALSSVSAGFTPAMELYAPDGRTITLSSATRFAGVLTNAGVHTVLARYGSGASRTGSYLLVNQRLNNPCGALPLECGTLTSGLVAPGQFVTYQFPGATGEVITLRMATTATAAPLWEVYDPDGVLLTPSGTTLTRTLTRTGTYTVLLFPASGNPQVVDYALALQRLKQPCQAVSLACGTVHSASLSANGEVDAYEFTGAGGEVWRLRLASISDYFAARMELFGPDSVLVVATTAEITRTLTNPGNYTVLVSWDNSANSRVGDYRLAAQRLSAPCGANPLTLGQPASGAIASATQMDAFSFASGPGPITLCLGENSATLVPLMELYDSAGVRLASSNTRQIQATLTNGGTFHLLVQDSDGTGTGFYTVNLLTGTVNCATVDLQIPTVSITAPAVGTFITRGTSFTIAWTTSDNGTLASHDVLLSLDGGATYPMALATGLPGTARSFVWAVPDGFTTAGWRVQVIARDATGNAGSAERDILFLVINPLDLSGISYRYDELSRLTGAQYPDGTAISYAYDAAGNRTNSTIVAGTNADSDGDGLPDAWEISNGLDALNAIDALADADGDSLSNRDEYLAGTDPQNESSVLSIATIAFAALDVRITFTSVPGKTYVVEQTEALSSGSWTPSGASLTGTGSLAQFIQTAGALSAQRFYRVRWLP